MRAKSDPVLLIIRSRTFEGQADVVQNTIATPATMFGDHSVEFVKIHSHCFFYFKNFVKWIYKVVFTTQNHTENRFHGIFLQWTKYLFFHTVSCCCFFQYYYVKYNRQNFIDERMKVARCRWEIMQPNGNNSHSSKVGERQFLGLKGMRPFRSLSRKIRNLSLDLNLKTRLSYLLPFTKK